MLSSLVCSIFLFKYTFKRKSYRKQLARKLTQLDFEGSSEEMAFGHPACQGLALGVQILIIYANQ